MFDNKWQKKEMPLVSLIGMGGGIASPAFLDSFVTGSLPVYADDVFSTYLYEGNGSTQTITNGIDLAGEGGMVWIKRRSGTTDHNINDTVRGAGKQLASNQNYAEVTNTNNFAAFTSDGFTVGTGSQTNATNPPETHVAWTFRKAPGFFDVVTYTGNGTNQSIAHNLGSVPGCIMIKNLSSSTHWVVYHRGISVPAEKALALDQTWAEDDDVYFNDTAPTSTHFTVGPKTQTNTNGDTYVAYIFAHDDQSFGTNGDESIIKCDSYTGASAHNIPLEVNVGFEPQWVLIKNASDANRSWVLLDMMRGWSGATESSASSRWLRAEDRTAEGGGTFGHLTPTGFVVNNSSFVNGGSDTFVYMAIRRPHKPPTSATEVFAIDTKTASSTNTPAYTSNFPVDLALRRDNITSTSDSFEFISRMTDSLIYANLSNAENAAGGVFTDYFARNNGWATGGSSSDSNDYMWMFRRAPGFFDTVTYTGDGSATRQISHNLEATPELIIVKSRSNTSQWLVWNTTFGHGTTGNYILLNSNSARGGSNPPIFTTSAPTSTHFNVAYDSGLNVQFTTNASSYTYIAHLFATLDGISKVGTYSGTGSNIDVDCGFTAGARFVLIKRTDYPSSGDWYVWDTARGIVSGNDPYLLMNSNNAEVTNTDYIDPLNAGFTVTSSAPAALNASGGEYLFLAIA